MYCCIHCLSQRSLEAWCMQTADAGVKLSTDSIVANSGWSEAAVHKTCHIILLTCNCYNFDFSSHLNIALLVKITQQCKILVILKWSEYRTQETYISWTNDNDMEISGIAVIWSGFNTWNRLSLQSLCLLSNK